MKLNPDALNDLYRALMDASNHLEYCGYGDSWERECADYQKLPQRIEAAIKKAESVEAA